MKILIVILIILFSQYLIAEPIPCGSDENSFRCVDLVSVYDGDTAKFNIKGMHPLLGKEISVRVGGIDTPEIRTKNKCEKQQGRTAKRLVENMLKHAKRIDLLQCKRGKYFRLVCEIVADSKNISEILLKNNLAYRYTGGTKSKVNWCSLASAKAGQEKGY